MPDHNYRNGKILSLPEFRKHVADRVIENYISQTPVSPRGPATGQGNGERVLFSCKQIETLKDFFNHEQNKKIFSYYEAAFDPEKATFSIRGQASKTPLHISFKKLQAAPMFEYEAEINGTPVVRKRDFIPAIAELSRTLNQYRNC
jgi:hypothetical protein